MICHPARVEAGAKEVVRIVGTFGSEVTDVAEVTEGDPTPLLHVITFRPANPERSRASERRASETVTTPAFE
jgi:hypothetical protein